MASFKTTRDGLENNLKAYCYKKCLICGKCRGRVKKIPLFDVISVLSLTLAPKAIHKQLERSNLSNEYVCVRCPGEPLARLTLERNEYMSIKWCLWSCPFNWIPDRQAVGLFNFNHHSAINGRHLQQIRKIFWLGKLDIKHWNLPPAVQS